MNKFLLASAVGFGVFDASVALAQQAPVANGASPVPTAANVDPIVAANAAYAGKFSADIITLANATPASRAAASNVSSANLVVADNVPAAAPSASAPVYNPYDHLGTNVVQRLWNYEKLELGTSSAPVDPTAPPAPPSIRDGWTPVPQTTPPMPFTDWPYGGTTMIGDNRTASIDSPLMVAIANTGLGKWLSNTGIQAYGWVDYGGNISSNRRKGGNAPAGYDFNPNNVQLDQAVLYVERTPDTVQTDHIDWGFRASVIYGENYRYTTAYGVASYQLLKHNNFYGYDFPMVYGEVWVPKILEGMMIRVGRYISIPDIEAQLAPNNYMYSHSISYTFDNFTNEGILSTLAVTKNVMVQLGVGMGTEAAVWHYNEKIPNLFVQNGGVDPLYPGKTMLKDPGAKPSISGCIRWQSSSGHDDLNVCADAINHGQWGYNNLQWYGFTYYHTFNKYWHVSFETYNEHQDGVINAKNPVAMNIYNNGGTPFSPQFIPFNSPFLAQCKSATVLRCKAEAQGALAYLNYSPNALNNISFRAEYYNDMQGQRTGAAAVYYEEAIGWQHWLSPQIELRPEFTYYHSSTRVFDAGAKKTARIFAGDIIVHF
ncbi:MAG TPA: outer membrane beta-barrel protein [Caulobacteraceae bacterium]